MKMFYFIIKNMNFLIIHHFYFLSIYIFIFVFLFLFHFYLLNYIVDIFVIFTEFFKTSNFQWQIQHDTMYPVIQHTKKNSAQHCYGKLFVT